jgi:glycosyltransferase involved in cell wall biosynthesis
MDQQRIPRPRIGYAGIIDWRVDLELVREIALRHPAWQMVMLGPVIGMDAQALPRAANLHYLGMKPYRDLPAYLRGWDVALLPLVNDDTTRVANPPQTLEYLAAGLPVVSTPIFDVVNPYGARRLVQIADGAAGFGAAIDSALRPGGRANVERAQSLLATMSWDRVFGTMCRIVQQSVRPAAMPVPVLVPSLQPTSHSAA